MLPQSTVFGSLISPRQQFCAVLPLDKFVMRVSARFHRWLSGGERAPCIDCGCAWYCAPVPPQVQGTSKCRHRNTLQLDARRAVHCTAKHCLSSTNHRVLQTAGANRQPSSTVMVHPGVGRFAVMPPVHGGVAGSDIRSQQSPPPPPATTTLLGSSISTGVPPCCCAHWWFGRPQAILSPVASMPARCWACCVHVVCGLGMAFRHCIVPRRRHVFDAFPLLCLPEGTIGCAVCSCIFFCPCPTGDLLGGALSAVHAQCNYLDG